MATNFFKIIDNPQDNRLRIPSEFMRGRGRNLTDHVYLKAPDGSVRQVQLLRSNGETWLLKGWKEFKQYYSIGSDHMLLFTYVMNNDFDIHIFDANGMEIEYPHDNPIDDDKGINFNRAIARVPETDNVESESKSESDSESESDDSVVFLKEISTSKKRKHQQENVETADRKGNNDFVETIVEDSSASQQRMINRSKSSSSVKQSSRKNVSFPNCRDEPVRSSKVRLEKCSEGIGNQSHKRVQKMVCKETSIAYQRAKSFQFCEPFNVSLMQPSYVSGCFILVF